MYASRGFRVFNLAVAMLVVAAFARTALAEPTYRDLVRKYAQLDPQKIPGVKQGEPLVALEYEVLLRVGESWKPIDAVTHQFGIGDQVRVRVTPLNNVFIYIFHEGASGAQVCLLPQGTEVAPVAQAGQTLNLPDDGFFEFSPPTGEEKLIVVATKEPSADLDALRNVVFHKPDDQLTSSEKAEKARLESVGEKKFKSLREKAASNTRYRGILDDATFRDASPSKPKLAQEPPSGTEGSTLAVLAGSSEMYLTIPLKSISLNIGAR